MNEKYTYEDQTETLKRKRELDILINVIEPDSQYQPYFVSDKATVYDVFGYSEQELRNSLETHFKMKLDISLDLPIWKLIDVLKQAGCF
ncbi:MAG: hypothetical protein WDA22_17240 [Bacteroidota bacterium]